MQLLKYLMFQGLLSGGQQRDKTITSDTYFYGQSPPVYPTPPGNGSGVWGDAYHKAALLVGNMTLDEKVSLTIGYRSGKSLCAGEIPPIPRLGFPGLCLDDAPAGVRNTDLVNNYAAGVHVGASWNKKLAYQRGYALGGEFRTKGANIHLGPTIGPMGRVARGGRNWESFSVDPYLSGALAAETVIGIQERGVIASTKHYIANEQETWRNPTQDPHRESVSSNIDDKTLHEFYLWPFQEALRAGSGSIMCSYNRVNNSYACGNSKLLNGILKTELGFQGFVVSDWDAQHGGVSTALAGLDMAMPLSDPFWKAGLGEAVKNGSVPEAQLDAMVTRIIAPWYLLKQDEDFPAPSIGIPADLRAPHPIIDARDPASKPVLLAGAIEGHVLVKNENSTLPLKSPRLLSIYGYSAHVPLNNNIGLFSSSSRQNKNSSYRAQGPFDPIESRGTIISGGGSGAITPAYVSSPFEGIAQRAYESNTALFWDFENSGAGGLVHPASEACLVFINAWAEEGWDRPGLGDGYSDELVLNIADKCPTTILTIHNAGPRLLSDRIASHPHIKSIIYAHLPGQDSGRALASLLWGDNSPSGRLPYSIPKNESDYPDDLLNPAMPDEKYQYFPQSEFEEGGFVDYRDFQSRGREGVRWEFGWGLSYSEFKYGKLSVDFVGKSEEKGGKLSEVPTGPIEQGGQIDLFDTLYTVSISLTNTGSVYAAEVPQLYITFPSSSSSSSSFSSSSSSDSSSPSSSPRYTKTPPHQLRGFDKIWLHPGEEQQVTFELRRKDLSVWDVKRQNWVLEKGEYKVDVGSSSRKILLNSTLEVPQ